VAQLALGDVEFLTLGNVFVLGRHRGCDGKGCTQSHCDHSARHLSLLLIVGAAVTIRAGWIVEDRRLPSRWRSILNVHQLPQACPASGGASPGRRSNGVLAVALWLPVILTPNLQLSDIDSNRRQSL
jgi:hypothetical protein